MEDTMWKPAAFLLLSEGEKSFLWSGIYSSKGTCVRIKKEIKFCNKLSALLNLLAEFHREKYNLYKFHKTMT